MTFVVPFDGSELSRAALVRAMEYGHALDESVVAISVIPDSQRYAREKDWIGDDEPFDAAAIADTLRRAVRGLAPDATFQAARVDASAGSGTIARRIRQEAAEMDAAVVFLGSENAGGIVIPVSSVGGTVASDARYDVYIVRRQHPSGISTIKDTNGFYSS